MQLNLTSLLASVADSRILQELLKELERRTSETDLVKRDQTKWGDKIELELDDMKYIVDLATESSWSALRYACFTAFRSVISLQKVNF